MSLYEGLRGQSFLFPGKHLGGGKYEDVSQRLWHDEEGLIYATYGVASVKMAKALSEYMRKWHLDTIADATGGLGSNIAAFATRMKKVIAYEIDATRYEALRRNMLDVYEFRNVQLHNESAVKLLEAPISKCAMFIDPPWGGRGYINRARINDLDMCGISFVDFVTRALQFYPVIGLKLPNNFDTTDIPGTHNEIRIHDCLIFLIIEKSDTA